MKKYISFLTVILSISAFFIVTGGKIIDPTNLAWINSHDPFQHYLGWAFFRSEPWSLPLGLNPSYGLALSNSIVYSDSIPLFAIPFKVISPWLGETFQYFGIWLVFVFTAQGLTALKIINTKNKNLLLVLSSVSFFIFSPVMLFRLSGHLSLSAHFLILYALYLHLRFKDISRPNLHWLILLCIASLTHAYLFFMVSGLWVAFLAQHFLLRKKTLLLLKIIIVTLVAVAVCMWLAGYFTVSGASSSTGFGHYKMNLIASLNSLGWSYFWPKMEINPGEYEGFNFLGLGLIILVVANLLHPKNSYQILKEKIRYYPFLFSISILFFLFSLSHNISFSTYSFEINIPEKIKEIGNIAQSSGRFFWPVFYLILIANLYLIGKNFTQKTATVLIMLAATIQITDTSAGWLKLKKMYMATPSTVPVNILPDPLTHPFWADALQHYDGIKGKPTQNNAPDWPKFSYLAHQQKSSTDLVYLARIDTHKLEQEQVAPKQNNMIYIFDQYQPEIDDLMDEKTDLLLKIEGLLVLVPQGGKFFGSKYQQLEVSKAQLLEPTN